MKKSSPVWNIHTMSPHTGDKKDLVAQYYNRGHAAAAIRGFWRRAWQAASEMQYTLTDGRIRP